MKPETTPTYTKLARSDRTHDLFTSLGHRSTSLWLGSDHVLQVTRSSFSESYKRCYFADIQAVTMHKSKIQLLGILVFTILGLLFCVPGISVLIFFPDIARATILTTLPFLLIPAALLLTTIWRGPSCVCEISTAVQTLRLHSLCRMRKANAVMQQLRPLIEASQQQQQVVDPEQEPMPDNAPAADSAAAAPVPAAARGRQQRQTKICRPYRSRIHIWVLCGLAAQTLSIVALLTWRNYAVAVASQFIGMTTLVASIWLLVKILQNTTPTLLRIAAIFTIVIEALNLAAGYGVYIFLIVNNITLANDNAAILRIYAQQDSPVLRSLSISAAIGLSLATLLMLIASVLHSPPPVAAPAPPPLPASASKPPPLPQPNVKHND